VKRLFASAVILAALAILMAPAVAICSTWTVRDRAGHPRGTVRNTHGLFQCDVKRPNGSWAGWISSNDSGSGIQYQVFKGKPRTVVGGGVAFVEYEKLYRPQGGTTIGLVVKHSSHWVVKRRMNGVFRGVGTVPGACPRGYAMGAGRLLLW
jgi:hypothetical protein